MELTYLDPVVSLVYHMVYGATLGGVYAFLTGRRTMTP
jgi:hypothetical protein